MTYKKFSFPFYWFLLFQELFLKFYNLLSGFYDFQKTNPFFVLAINERNDVMNTAIDFNVFVSKCSRKQ